MKINVIGLLLISIFRQRTDAARCSIFKISGKSEQNKFEFRIPYRVLGQ